MKKLAYEPIRTPLHVPGNEAKKSTTVPSTTPIKISFVRHAPSGGMCSIPSLTIASLGLRETGRSSLLQALGPFKRQVFPQLSNRLTHATIHCELVRNAEYLDRCIELCDVPGFYDLRDGLAGRALEFQDRVMQKLRENVSRIHLWIHTHDPYTVTVPRRDFVDLWWGNENTNGFNKTAPTRIVDKKGHNGYLVGSLSKSDYIFKGVPLDYLTEVLYIQQDPDAAYERGKPRYMAEIKRLQNWLPDLEWFGSMNLYKDRNIQERAVLIHARILELDPREYFKTEHLQSILDIVTEHWEEYTKRQTAFQNLDLEHPNTLMSNAKILLQSDKSAATENCEKAMLERKGHRIEYRKLKENYAQLQKWYNMGGQVWPDEYTQFYSLLLLPKMRACPKG